MKKLVFTTALFFIAFVNANEIKRSTPNFENYNHYYEQPLKFIERGVEFFIFPNGEFDFNTHPRYHNTHYRRSSVRYNVTYGAPSNFHNRGVRIEHDYLGRVRRIGNVFINYDRYGRIKRIGSVYMSYHHHWLSRIGGLHLYYDRYHNIIRTVGFIKPNMGCHFCGTMNCTINHYNNHHAHHHNHWNDDEDWDEDWGSDSNDDMYYYRSKSAKKSTERKTERH